jgi:hypothetical protein
MAIGGEAFAPTPARIRDQRANGSPRTNSRAVVTVAAPLPLSENAMPERTVKVLNSSARRRMLADQP